MGSICSNCGNASNQSKFHRKFQNPCCNNEMLLDFDSIKNLKAEVERLEKEKVVFFERKETDVSTLRGTVSHWKDRGSRLEEQSERLALKIYRIEAEVERLREMIEQRQRWIFAESEAAKGLCHSPWCAVYLPSGQCNCVMKVHAEVARYRRALERIALQEPDTEEGCTYGEMCLAYNAIEMAETASAVLKEGGES